MKKQKNKCWFITGVSSGLGRHLMLAALERGDSVTGTVRRQEQAEEIEKLAPGRSRAAVLDVTNEAAVKSAIADAEKAFAGVDVIVNNAGYGLLGAIEETTADEVQQQFATNVFGALHVIRAAIPYFRERKAGHILNVTSIGGLVAYPGWSIYNGTKFALEGLSSGLAKEVADFGVKVTAVEPSAFRTDWAGRSLKRAATAIDDYAQSTPRNWIDDLDGNQPGDPVRAALAMLALVDMDEPPTQLLLGSEAFEEAVGTFEAALNQFRAHLELTNSADFQEK